MKNLLLVLLFLSTGSFLFAQKQKEAELLVNDGVKLYDKGDYQGALSKYDQALKLDENNFYAMAEKAMTFRALKKYYESIKLCKEIVKLHASHEQLKTVYVTWGSAEDGLRNHDAAIKIYNEGIKIYPDFYTLYFNKGIALTNIKNHSEAILQFEKSMQLNPMHAGSHNAVARLQYGKNRIISLMAFLRFLSLEPLGERAKGNLAIVRELLGQNVEKTGKKAVTITLDGKMLGDTTESGENNPNNFSTVDLILSLQSALDMDKSNKKKNEVELFESKLKSIAETLSSSKEKNSGFYWEFYAPYFISMLEEKQTETFSYIVYASSDEKYVTKWIDANKEKLKIFYKWSESFEWYKE